MPQRKQVENIQQDKSHDSGHGPSANHVTLIGRIATTPELRSTTGGTPVTSFRIAVNGRGETQFLTVVAWRQQAEFAAQYLTSGRLIHVDGRLQSRAWDGPDGSHRQVVEIVADSVQALTAPPQAAGAS